MNGGPVDAYTPANFQTLQNNDADLGSTAPAILPVARGQHDHTPRAAVRQGREDPDAELVESERSGRAWTHGWRGRSGDQRCRKAAECSRRPRCGRTQPTAAAWVFVTNGSGISALKLGLGTGGVPQLTTAWQKTGGGFSPLVANGVVYYAGSNNLRALDPTTGNQLWSDTTIGSIHWESPVVANGVLYLTDGSSHLTAYSAPATTKFSAKINFQPAGHPFPAVIWRTRERCSAIAGTD